MLPFLADMYINSENYVQVDQVDVRIKAVNLIGKMLALPKNCLAEKYHDLFVEFLRRFSDKSAEVRLRALRCAKACYLANQSGANSHEILSKPICNSYSSSASIY